MNTLTRETLALINNVALSPNQRFDHLLETAGLDPKHDLRFADLRNVDFDGSVMRKWDFTGADLRGASFRGATLLACIFADAIGVDLTGAIRDERRPRRLRSAKPQFPDKPTSAVLRAGKTSDRLTELQRLSLAAIIQYHLSVQLRRGHRLTYAELGNMAGLRVLLDKESETEGRRGSHKKLLADRVRRIALGVSSRGELQLREFYKRLIVDGRSPFGETLPPHIKAAVDTVFEGGINSESNYSLQGVFTAIQDMDERDLAHFGEAYSGVWNMIRFSSSVVPYESEGRPEHDPWVVRAAMKIGPIDDRSRRPLFLIDYVSRNRGDVHSITGSIVLINRDRHFLLIGVDHAIMSPLFVISQLSEDRVGFFRALLVQRTSEGKFFASHVSFARSEAKAIEELRDKIGIFRESEFRKKFSSEIHDLDECLRSAVNEIQFGGRGVLKL